MLLTAIRRAHEYFTTGEAADGFCTLLSLVHAPHLSAAIKALLICPDVSCGYVARWLHLPEQVVEAFAQLFWNAHYRREEQSFMLGLVYPVGVAATWNKKAPISFEQFLLQTAHRSGAQGVLAALGALPQSTSPATLSDIERLTIAQGFQQAQLGGLHDEPPTALRESLRLMQAEKLHRLNNPVRDEQSRLALLERGISCAMEDIYRHGSGETLSPTSLEETRARMKAGIRASADVSGTKRANNLTASKTTP